MATPLLQSACLPLRREGAQTMRRVRRFLLCPIVPLINPNYASSASAQMVQHRLGDFEAHAEALQPCRKRSAKAMQLPTGNTRCGVERRLSLSISRPILARWRALKIISDEPAMSVLNARRACLDKKAKKSLRHGHFPTQYGHCIRWAGLLVKSMAYLLPRRK